ARGGLPPPASARVPRAARLRDRGAGLLDRLLLPLPPAPRALLRGARGDRRRDALPDPRRTRGARDGGGAVRLLGAPSSAARRPGPLVEIPEAFRLDAGAALEPYEGRGAVFGLARREAS